MASPTFSWPILENGLSFLEENGILDDETWRQYLIDHGAIGKDATEALFESWKNKLSTAVKTSISEGEGQDEWFDRLDKFGIDADHEAERIHRTASHDAYDEGYRAVLADEDVGAVFTHWKWISTNDNRTRPAHRALDGKVCPRDSALASTMDERIKDWNCRCTRIAITAADAGEKMPGSSSPAAAPAPITRKAPSPYGIGAQGPAAFFN